MRISDWSSDVCSSDLWQAFIRNAKRVRTGDRIDFSQGVAAIASERTEDGGIILDFEGDEPVEVLLERAGTMPLPPYIASTRAPAGRDREDRSEERSVGQVGFSTVTHRLSRLPL